MTAGLVDTISIDGPPRFRPRVADRPRDDRLEAPERLDLPYRPLPARELPVYRVALRLRLVAHAGRPVNHRRIIDAHRVGERLRIDDRGIPVENLPNLLARKRHHIAAAQPPVVGPQRREPELLAYPVDFGLADPVLRQRLDKRLLDGEHLLVVDLLPVREPPRLHVVVHLPEPVFPRELHLPRIVLAGRDLLELLERDVDIGKD